MYAIDSNFDAIKALAATSWSAKNLALDHSSMWRDQRCKGLSAGAESGGQPECSPQ